MRTVVWTGSRGWQDTETILDAIVSIKRPFRSIVGDARGWDALVWETLAEFKMPRLQFKAKWNLYRNGAGPKRNALMLDWLQRIDRDGFVVAGWDGESSGTHDCMMEAELRGIPIWRVKYTPALNGGGQ
jgi:hypothetical protein